MTMKEAVWAVKEYGMERGATVKVIGDYAWRSPRYEESPRRGRMVRLVTVRDGRVLAWDSKLGYVTIDKTI